MIMMKGSVIGLMNEQPGWTLFLLGSFHLERDGEVVARFGARREELLLAYLALAPDVAHHRRRLAEVLWPQREPNVAGRNVSYNLWLLRNRLRELGLPDGIWIGARTIQLNPKIATDVRRFGELAVSAAHVADMTERARLLELALAMYGDGLLPSFTAAWIEPERSRLMTLYQATVRHLSETLGPDRGLHQLLQAVPTATWRHFQESTPTASSGRSPLLTPPWVPPALLPGDRERLRSFVVEMEPHLNGPNRVLWLSRVDGEYGVIAALLEEAIAREDRIYGMEIAGRLWRYWYVRGMSDEGRNYLERLLPISREPITTAHARALHAAGTLALMAGDLVSARRRLQGALVIWRSTEDDDGLVKTLANLGMVAYREADFVGARHIYGQCLAISRRLDDPVALMSRLLNAALVELRLGDSSAARSLLQERLAVVAQTGDQFELAVTLAHLATVDIQDGDPASARTRAQEARTLFQALDEHAGQAFALRLLARAAQEDGDFESAFDLYARSLEEAQASGSMREVGETLRQLARAHKVIGNPDQATELVRQAEALSNAAGDAPGVEQARSLAQEVWAGREDPAITSPSVDA
jgi:tetratricopeptide (TPR) repeat protein